MIKTNHKVIPMTYDKIFKSVLESDDTRNYLISIINEITGIPKDALKSDMRFKNSEMPVTNVNEKRKILDLIVDIKDCVINLEMNKYYYEGLVDRNHEYISKIRESLIKEGEDYSYLRKVIQINFDDYNMYKPEERAIIKFEMMDETGLKEGVGVESYHVILPNVKEKYYNEGVKDGIIGKLVIMMMEDSKELEKIIKENMELRPVGKKILELSKDEEMQGWYDEEEHERKVRNSIIATGIRKGWNQAVQEGKEKGIKEGIKEGIKKGIKEGIKKGKKEGIDEGIKETKETIAINMLNRKIDIKMISDVTGLSEDEIEKLKKC